MKRSEMRELAFELIYSMEIQEENVEEQINNFLEANEVTDEETQKYINNIVKGIKEHKEELTAIVEKNLKSDWNIKRISKIDFSILQLAIFEIKYNQLPYKVSINESVELAKKFGEDSSKNFVNGILASVVKQLEETN